MSDAAERGGEPAPSYLRTATTPRMLVLLVVLLAAAAVCARLGVWQLDRAEIRGATASEQDASSAAVPLNDVLEPQTAPDGAAVGREVVVAGVYEPDQLLVADRVLDDRPGFLVLSPLRVQEDADAGAGAPVLAVVRGWVADAAAASRLDPPPTGLVRVTGYLRPGEASRSEDLPDGQVGAVSPAELVNRWGGPTYSAYLTLTASDPAQDARLSLLPSPSPDAGGLNLQNLAYALQWWIFGGFALTVWARLVRDETRTLRDELEPVLVTPGSSAAEAGARP